jgi:glycosyltransferase involved in cell wall biosynthesis
VERACAAGNRPAPSALGCPFGRGSTVNHCCIATDVGGTSDALGDAGILVPANDVEAFAAALRSLLEDGNLRREMAERSVQRVRERFTLDTAVRQTISLFPIL